MSFVNAKSLAKLLVFLCEPVKLTPHRLSVSYHCTYCSFQVIDFFAVNVLHASAFKLTYRVSNQLRVLTLSWFFSE